MRITAMLPVALALFLSGCDDEKKLVGTWRCTSQDVCDTATWTFHADGAFTFSSDYLALVKKSAKASGRSAVKTLKAPITATWKMDMTKKPNVVTIKFTDGVDTLYLNTIQEFRTTDTMRIGVDYYDLPPPASFEAAWAVAEFARQ